VVTGRAVQEHFRAAHLFNAARDAIAMQRAHTREGLQDHQVRRSMKEIESVVAHCADPDMWSYHMSNWTNLRLRLGTIGSFFRFRGPSDERFKDQTAAAGRALKVK
jgi:hypothetical protein